MYFEWVHNKINNNQSRDVEEDKSCSEYLNNRQYLNKRIEALISHNCSLFLKENTTTT